MHPRRRFILHALFGWGALRAHARPPEEGRLILAVHPYNSTLALVATYRPLVRYLERQLRREVEFFIAPGFDAFLAALLAGEYDVAICPPHFALLAMERGYRPLAAFRARLEPVLAVPTASSLRSLTDVRGRRVAMADRAAIIRIAVVRRLEEKGIVAGRDYQIVEVQTHGAAMAAAALGEADAGLTTTTAIRQAPADIRARLRTLSTGLSFPHLVTIGHPRLGDSALRSMGTALLAFEEHVEGREFFHQTGFEGYDPLNAEALAVLKPYAELYRRMTGR